MSIISKLQFCYDMDLSQKIIKAFPAQQIIPSISLRCGDSRDGYGPDIPYDAMIDEPSDEYLERYGAGITFLDAESWRYYLPLLMRYALNHLGGSRSMVVDYMLLSLRPPDREPPRLGSLTPEQESVIAEFLEVLAFDDRSGYQANACQVLEEYWIPGALYRNIKD